MSAISGHALESDNATMGVTAQVGCARDLHVRRVVDENPAGLRERAAASLGSSTRKLRASSGRIAASHAWYGEAGVGGATGRRR